MIVSLLKIALLFLYTVVLSLVGGILLLTPDGQKKWFRVGQHWAHSIMAVCGVRIKVAGAEKIRDPRGIVYLANHASMFDIWALMGWLPGQLRFVGKKEINYVPVLGWLWKYSGNIPIDRKTPKKYVQSLETARRSILAGNCIVMYPEGTRTADGRLQEFKRGPFSLAVKANARIVPVTINGSFRLMKKGSFKILPGTIDIVVHDPIPTGDGGKDEELGLMTAVRERIQSAYIDQEAS
jgi:1-acyl-sn-glycerol-3-phosphate acyltransferase